MTDSYNIIHSCQIAVKKKCILGTKITTDSYDMLTAMIFQRVQGISLEKKSLYPKKNSYCQTLIGFLQLSACQRAILSFLGTKMTKIDSYSIAVRQLSAYVFEGSK